jgi:UDP-N-acetylglucosamine:LPS N-acetylglucosamine transferase
MAAESRQRVLLVGSSGGHLAQLLALRAWWEQREHAWVTFDTPDALSALEGEQVWWAHHPTTRSLRALALNLGLAVRVLWRFRPTVIVSTGAGVAFPFFVVGRLLGARTVYIEVFDRVETPTLTARLCRPLTSTMLVQWPEQAALYDDAIVVGPLL